MSARYIAVLAITAMLACDRYKVTVPLETPEARTCADTCAARYGGTRPDLRRSCLASCPGAREASGRCTAAERPPEFACAYETKMSTAGAVATTVGIIVLVAAAVVGVALAAGADTIDDDPP